ncbi:Tir chaperone protein (CesT) family [Shewanella psychrophila]|uniref:Tir chaperone protein (CesT) family n=1 Tax=Shewanella psychrophila TaxID=225848 RepID=A0A1S6HYE4_9GAMM|nr:CesT family type III secretion system chaperone [Shewanella psychrophila]AQS40616.1 Tir chaperone protein (CesT) family [Shewanella psychrophila]
MKLEETLSALLASLSEDLNQASFVANSDGRYNLSFDDVAVEFYLSHGWLIIESDLNCDLSQGLNYQQESALEKIMQQALVNVRAHTSVLAINEMNRLTLIQRVEAEVLPSTFITMVNHQVDIAERYQELMQQHTLSSSDQNRVWLP